MNHIIKYLSVIAGLFLTLGAWSQITTATFNVSKDVHVSDGSVNTNYGSSDSLWVHYARGAQGSIERTFIQFDVGSLPDEAIIVSATLKMKPADINNDEQHPFFIERVDEFWSEGTINWANAPDVYTSDQISIAHNQTTDTVLHEFDVTDHVEQMHWYNQLNFGWRIRLQTESGQQTKGVKYYSSEHDSTSWQPELEVEYILPPEIKIGVIHSEKDSTNGLADIDYSGGSSGTPTYYWIYKWSAGVLGVIQHGANPDNNDLDINDLAAGLYHIRVRDSLYSVVNNDKFFFSKWFLVGQEGVTTSIDWYHSEGFMYDVTIARNKTTDPNPQVMEDINYDYAQYMSAAETPVGSGTRYEHAGLQRWNIDFDPLLEFTKADLTMKPHYHSRATTSSNAVDVRYVSGPWLEEVVTWNTRPSVDSTVILTYAQTEPSGTNNDPDTMDYRQILEYWQANPQLNYGLEYRLSNQDQNKGAFRMWRDFHFSQGSGPILNIEFNVRAADTLYWVGVGSELDWDDPINWSDESGGAGGVGVPHVLSTVVFDGNGNYNCYSEGTKTVAEIKMISGYTSNLEFGDNELISNQLSIQNE